MEHINVLLTAEEVVEISKYSIIMSLVKIVKANLNKLIKACK